MYAVLLVKQTYCNSPHFLSVRLIIAITRWCVKCRIIIIIIIIIIIKNLILYALH